MGSRENQLANYVLGLGLILQTQTYEQRAVSTKSCDAVMALATLLNEAKGSLTIGRTINADVAEQRLQQIDQYYFDPDPKVGRIAQLTKGFCN